MLWIATFMAAVFAGGVALLARQAFLRTGTPDGLSGTLPAAWRAAWPWLEALEPLCDAQLTLRSRKRLHARIEQAGLSLQMSAGHFAAARWLCAASGGVLCLALATPLVAPGEWRLLALVCATGALAAATVPHAWLKGARRRRAIRMSKELPFLMDMTTLCVESGLNLQGALQQAARNGPDGPLRDELLRALGDMRAGVPRVQALRAWAVRVELPAVRALTASMAQADALGMSLGPILRAQSEQRRTERFQAAERLAMQAPVKMLFPLIACIFPCTFIVLAFPIGVQILEATQ
jgi:tight adherence protein C